MKLRIGAGVPTILGISATDPQESLDWLRTVKRRHDQSSVERGPDRSMAQAVFGAPRQFLAVLQPWAGRYAVVARDFLQPGLLLAKRQRTPRSTAWPAVFIRRR